MSSESWLQLCFSGIFYEPALNSHFNQEIRTEFGLSHARFGALYTVATLVGGSLLLGIGRRIDSMALRRYTLLACLGLAFAALLLASASSLMVLFLSMCLLRLCGQGLMGHIAITSMARYFSQDRGRAVAVANLGFPLGEALLPGLLVAISPYFLWRETWGLVGGGIAFLLLPLLLWLPSKGKAHNRKDDLPSWLSSPQQGRRNDYDLSEVIRDPNFYRMIPALVVLPFVITGVFINSSFIADQKAWDFALIASGFLAFAFARIAGSLFVGTLIDRIGSPSLLPFSLLSLIAGLAGLSLGTHPIFWINFMAAAGLSSGTNGVLAGTLWAEVYGVRHLGAIRALYQAVMIFAAGLAPLSLGLLIEAAWSIEAIVFDLALLTLLAAALTPGKRHRAGLANRLRE